MLRPGLAFLGIFTFIGAWNDYIWPLIVLVNPDHVTLQVALAQLNAAHGTDYSMVMAGALLAVIPLVWSSRSSPGRSSLTSGREPSCAVPPPWGELPPMGVPRADGLATAAHARGPPPPGTSPWTVPGGSSSCPFPTTGPSATWTRPEFPAAWTHQDAVADLPHYTNVQMPWPEPPAAPARSQPHGRLRARGRGSAGLGRAPHRPARRRRGERAARAGQRRPTSASARTPTCASEFDVTAQRPPGR